jgi:methionyl aminopeptidase
VIQPFTGHGIGASIHEGPAIPSFVSADKNALLVAGMVLCIEPIFCIGEPAIYHKKGEWNTWMLSGQPVCHFEHTIVVNPAGQPPTILTLRSNENI